jgi:hypothetical protein
LHTARCIGSTPDAAGESRLIKSFVTGIKNNQNVFSENQHTSDYSVHNQRSDCVGPDGRIYLVYVESDPDPRTQRRASLWQTSLMDSGATWTKPAQITDGLRCMEKHGGNGKH